MTATVAHPALKTRVTELFGIEYPVVQTGMGYVSDARLTAATSAAGGLGIIGSGLMSQEELAAAITAVKELTDKPFGVNVRASQPDVEQRIDLLIREGVKVASFALAPRQDLITRCKEGGLVVVPSVGAVRHAEKVKAWGADAVVVQGAEGGGHTGVVPTSLLLPQVAGAVDIAVIGAGGFFDGRGLVAALAYGAAGIAMGTRFLLTRESPVADAVKRLYLTKTVTDTVVTSEIDGVPQRLLNAGQLGKLQATTAPRRLVRAVRSAVLFHRLTGTSWPDMIREGIDMKRDHDLRWTQVIMAANAPVLYRSALLDGRTDIGVSASGQVVGLIDDIPSCAELIERVVREASDVLARLGGRAMTLAGPGDGHQLLAGKTVLVTAAAGTGIGSAAALRCASEGATVAISDRHERRLAEAARTLEERTGKPPLAIGCDGTVQEQVDHLIDTVEAELGGIDVLINNVGLGGEASIVDMTDDQWHAVLDVTLTATFRATRAALRHMVPRRRGVIVNNASVLGWRAQPGQAHYAAAKAGVMALTRCAAMDVAQYGIRINAVSPSIAMHPFLAKVTTEEALAELVSREAFGRAAEPWEVANVMVFLASDYSSYLTGEVVSVSSQHP